MEIILITIVRSFTNSLSRTSLYFSLKTSFVYSNLFSLAKTVTIRCYIQTFVVTFKHSLLHSRAFTRGKEHLDGMDRDVSQSVLRRHANDCHNGVIPDYVMNVTGVYHGDAMLRQITESINIRREGSINNKTEWNSITLPQAAIVK